MLEPYIHIYTGTQQQCDASAEFCLSMPVICVRCEINTTNYNVNGYRCHWVWKSRRAEEPNKRNKFNIANKNIHLHLNQFYTWNAPFFTLRLLQCYIVDASAAIAVVVVVGERHLSTAFRAIIWVWVTFIWRENGFVFTLIPTQWFNTWKLPTSNCHDSPFT